MNRNDAGNEPGQTTNNKQQKTLKLKSTVKRSNQIIIFFIVNKR